MTPCANENPESQRHRIPPPNQVPWVDELLWQWGAWVRRNDEAGYVGSALGRMYKAADEGVTRVGRWRHRARQLPWR